MISYVGELVLTNMVGVYTFINDEGVECVSIPMDLNNIRRGKLPKKSLVYRFLCFDRKPNRYGQSHLIKTMNRNKKGNKNTKNEDIVGNMRKYNIFNKFIEEKKSTSINDVINEIKDK